MKTVKRTTDDKDVAMHLMFTPSVMWDERRLGAHTGPVSQQLTELGGFPRIPASGRGHLVFRGRPGHKVVPQVFGSEGSLDQIGGWINHRELLLENLQRLCHQLDGLFADGPGGLHSFQEVPPFLLVPVWIGGGVDDQKGHSGTFFMASMASCMAQKRAVQKSIAIPSYAVSFLYSRGSVFMILRRVSLKMFPLSRLLNRHSSSSR